MVKSEKVYTPQSFVEALTGKCYTFSGESVVASIEALLDDNFIKGLWNYPLSEIDHIVENELDVVLVDVSGFNEDDEWVQEYRWFQVPDDFEEGLDEDNADAADDAETIEDNEDCAVALFNYLVATKAIKGTAAEQENILHDINNLRGHEWLEGMKRTPKTERFFAYLLGDDCEENE